MHYYTKKKETFQAFGSYKLLLICYSMFKEKYGSQSSNYLSLEFKMDMNMHIFFYKC